MSSLLIKNGTIVTMDRDGRIIEDGYVYVEDDLIREVGGQPGLHLVERAEETIDASGMAIIPGLVNAHTHLFQTLIRGLADDKPLLQWLQSVVWPVTAAMNEEECYWAALLGCLENLRSGATSIISQHYINASLHNFDRVAEAVSDSGIRALLARGFADKNYYPAIQEDERTILLAMERATHKWQGAAAGRIGVEFGPLIPWGCSEHLMTQVVRLATEWGVGIHIHIAETREEVEMVLAETGKRNIEWCADLGVLGPRTQLVHCVWLTPAEITTIAASGSTVVHCPVSNMYLASGIAPIAKMRKKGVNVAIATDGPASNNSQDMLEVLKFTACLQKVHTLNSRVILPEDVLEMATLGGARAMGLADTIGSLEVGRKADIAVIDLDTPHTAPVHRVPSALVYNTNCGDVDTVIVDGRVLLQGKRFCHLDEEAVLKTAGRAARGLLARAGVKVS
ncbi:MAG: amidohydrolase [Chloroflexi bacterium]|nr:amidohydrolase [Chloroflexota bacterium]MCL5076167.1 amidohydrolase [Chloroflexota bacterium]